MGNRLSFKIFLNLTYLICYSIPLGDNQMQEICKNLKQLKHCVLIELLGCLTDYGFTGVKKIVQLEYLFFSYEEEKSFIDSQISFGEFKENGPFLHVELPFVNSYCDWSRTKLRQIKESFPRTKYFYNLKNKFH